MSVPSVPGPTAFPALAVTVPATSANLGPGFDALGLAWDLVDEVRLEVADEFAVSVTGEGAGRVPEGRRHLVIATLLSGLADLGSPVPDGIRLSAVNRIPHGRGLGSSAAAVVTGLMAAWTWARPGRPVDERWLLRRARAAEGHLDNAAPALLGGLTLVVPGEDRVVRLPLDERLMGLAFIPDGAVATRAARGALPPTVPHPDASASVACAALLVHALQHSPQDLLAGTQDWLHQPYRAPLMPASAALLDRLRNAGHAAVISGAGPTVVVLGTPADLSGLDEALGFRLRRLRPAGGARVEFAPAHRG